MNIDELLGDASVPAHDAYGQKAEATFQRMKQLAAEAGWPSLLTPEIVAIDKEWQKAKEDTNAARRTTFGKGSAEAAKLTAIAFGKLESMVARLEAYLKDRKALAVSTELKVFDGGSMLDVFSRPYGPLPLWGWAVGAGLLVTGYFLVRAPR